ncbi:MAG: hypothetical protein MJ072_00810 [Clostridia bacterium]|nr:hypothetical protein [Clostridia bacterium]
MAKKKGLVSKLIIGKEKSDEYVKGTLPTSRWELFWDVIKGNALKLVGNNALTLLTLLPFAFVLLLCSSFHVTYGANAPFNVGFGIGYPAVPQLMGVAEISAFQSDLQTLIFVPITAIIAGLGLAGCFYNTRNLAWQEGVFVAQDFLRGIKKNFFVVAGSLLLLSVVSVLDLIAVDYIDILITQGIVGEWVSILCKIFAYTVIGFFTIVTFYMITMGVTYELKFFDLFKNAVILTIVYLPGNLVITLAAFLPFALFLLGEMIAILGVVLLGVFGISFAALVWTVYAHYVFDKSINLYLPKESRNRGLYSKEKRIKDDEIEKYKENKKVFTKLTSRPIKPIDDDIPIDSLPDTFRREDIERLNAQKEFMRKDAEEYEKLHYNDERYVEARNAIKDQALEEEQLKRIERELSGGKKKKKKGKK